MTVTVETKTIPAVLLPYQQTWVSDQAQVKLWEKSRRIGASWTEAASKALTASAQNGRDGWYIGYSKDMAEEFIGDVAFWARNYNLAAAEMEEIAIDDEGRDIQAFRIRFASGFKVTALSSRPRNLRGKQGDITIDEAAFHDDLPGLLKAAMALLMWGGRVVVISTHNGDDNPFNELVKDIRGGKKPYSLHRTTLDDALEAGLYKRICLKLGKDWSSSGEAKWRQDLINTYGDDADEELFVIPSKGSGTYLTRALIEGIMSPSLPVLRWTAPAGFVEWPEQIREATVNDWCEETLLPLLINLDPNLNSFFGEDFGRTGDLTVIKPLIEHADLTLVAPFIVELRDVPFQQQKQILFYIIDRLPRFSHGAMDARGNGQYLAEVAMQRYGANRIEQVMLTVGWYRDNMPKYKTRFEDKTMLIPKDADILADNRAIKVNKGVAQIPDNARTKGVDGKQRHGDGAIAGALAVYATTLDPYQAPEYETVTAGRFEKRGVY